MKKIEDEIDEDNKPIEPTEETEQRKEEDLFKDIVESFEYYL